MPGLTLVNPLRVEVGPSGDIFVADANAASLLKGSRVLRIDPVGGSFTTLAASSEAQSLISGLGISSTGLLLLARPLGISLSEMDPATGVDTPLPGASGFFGAVAEEASGDLIVADGAMATLVRYDRGTGTQTTLASLSDATLDLLIEADGSILALVGATDLILRIDPVTGAPAVLLSQSDLGIRDMALGAGGEIFASASIPEPGTLILIGVGLTGLALARRRARRTH